MVRSSEPCAAHEHHMNDAVLNGRHPILALKRVRASAAFGGRARRLSIGPCGRRPLGFCYVDPDAGLGAEELVSDCPATSPRKLRFLGSESPANENRWFLSCLGAG